MNHAVRVPLWATVCIILSAQGWLLLAAPLLPLWFVCALRATREGRHREGWIWLVVQGVWWAPLALPATSLVACLAWMGLCLVVSGRYLPSRDAVLWTAWCLLSLLGVMVILYPFVVPNLLQRPWLSAALVFCMLLWLLRATSAHTRTRALYAP